MNAISAIENLSAKNLTTKGCISEAVGKVKGS